MIIAIAGRAGTGKTTAAAYLQSRYGFGRDALAAPLKEMARDIYGLTDAQMNTPKGKATLVPHLGVTPRHILQRLGTEIVRQHLGPNVWANALIERWGSGTGGTAIVVDDCRFPNEAGIIRDNGGAIVKLVRVGIDLPPEDPDRDMHPSEMGVDLIEADYTLEADHTCGKEALTNDLDRLVADIRKTRKI